MRLRYVRYAAEPGDAVRPRIICCERQPDVSEAEQLPGQAFDAVIYHGDSDQLRELCEQVAARDGAIVSVQGFARGETNLLLERLYIERSLSVNTAAAGGNASLMTIG